MSLPYLTACNACGTCFSGDTDAEQLERVEAHEWSEHAMIDGRAVVTR